MPRPQLQILLVAPAIFVLLLIGLFPLDLLAGRQLPGHHHDRTTDTSFAGLRNYAQLFEDARLWESLLHTR